MTGQQLVNFDVSNREGDLDLSNGGKIPLQVRVGNLLSLLEERGNQVLNPGQRAKIVGPEEEVNFVDMSKAYQFFVDLWNMENSKDYELIMTTRLGDSHSGLYVRRIPN